MLQSALYGTQAILYSHCPLKIFELDDDIYDRYYIPARVAALLRPRLDFIILPRHQAVSDFWQFCQRILRYTDDQVLWTSDTEYCMDEDITTECVGLIAAIANKKPLLLFPYSVSDEFEQWRRQLSNVHVFGDTPALVKTFGHKGILHPHINGDIPALITQVPDVRVARGFRCSSASDIREAQRRLNCCTILKPEEATTGEGICKNPDPDCPENFHFGQTVVLEALLSIDQIRDTMLVPSIQFNGQTIFGGVVDQLLGDHNDFAGNIFPSLVPAQIQTDILNQTRKLLAWKRPSGPGSFDFIVSGGVPYFSDPNLGRSTGAHPAKLFHAVHAPNTPAFCTWKHTPKKSVWWLWERLKQRGLAFDQNTGRGVFPLCHLPDMWGMPIALGHSREEVLRMRQIVLSWDY